MRNSLHFTTALRNEAIGFALILGIWAAAAVFYPPYVIPSPLAVLTSVTTFLPQDFARHLGITLYRTLTGFGMALGAGTGFGMIAYAKKWVKPLNSMMLALQVLPGTILGVIFLLMFGIGDSTPIAMVAVLTLPPMAINTMNGLSNKNRLMEEYLRSIGATRRHYARYLYLPALVPTLHSNLSVGLGMAVKVVVLGEFIGAQDGIGYLLNTGRILFNMREVFFYLLVLMLTTLIFQAALSGIFSLFFMNYSFAEGK